MTSNISLQRASNIGIAERWRRRYFIQKSRTWESTEARKTYQQLYEVSVDASIATVAEIIGNKNWNYFKCTSCKTTLLVAVVISDDYRHEATLCKPCAAHALSLFEGTSV